MTKGSEQMANQWSETEDAAVREYYPTKGPRGCRAVLRDLGYDRTEGAIKERAKHLKVKRDMSLVRRDVDGAWTDEEISVLRSEFPKGGAERVRTALEGMGYERTAGAISTRAAMLGVKMSNTKRRMERSGDTKLVNICLDTELDSDVIDKLNSQRNRSEYLRNLVRRDIGS